MVIRAGTVMVVGLATMIWGCSMVLFLVRAGFFDRTISVSFIYVMCMRGDR